ncbi:GNAT family N-acetyltransferase [Dasania marina]|uniref:GNAT family N-acetyltransferase n=1 Tax=Dasania marina TaxID=471499 RepID=UPI0030DD0F2A|tara:strand:+ start:7500 stop:7961 length:462 start_codon:yes stop_codon:yes gene_type:complete
MLNIQLARIDQSDLVAQGVYDLLLELFPAEVASFPLAKLQQAAFQSLRPDGGVWSLLALNEQEQVVGMLNLSRCVAIYAGGEFGEIAEMYVRPDYRSQKVGEQLMARAKRFAKEKGWATLEVGAPDVPRCQRTVDFYQRNGFNMVGPRLEFSL